MTTDPVKKKAAGEGSHPEGEVRIVPLTFSISTKVVPLCPAMGCFIPRLRARLKHLSNLLEEIILGEGLFQQNVSNVEAARSYVFTGVA